MTTVRVECSGSYDVRIGNGVLDTAPQVLKELFGNVRFMIVTDDNVAPIYLKKLEKALLDAGFVCDSFVFEHGEANKTMATVTAVCELLAEKSYTGTDMLIALGGGIVGDVTGFAASIYQRGIRFVQIPTTLLAAVDSSVGGKTGVNLGGLKNQIGAFWQPSLVLCDPLTFGTLPKSEFASGMAEVVKYAAICRASLAEKITDGADIEKIIAECVAIKRDIVQGDERDTGLRRLLNLGHTFGHAVEKVTKNAFNHGQAVAIGTVMAFRASEAIGFCVKGDGEKVERLLCSLGLPVSCDASATDLITAMQNDKKRTGSEITLVLPRSFGDTALYKIPMSVLPDILDKALGN